MAPASARLAMQIALLVVAYYLVPIGEPVSGTLPWVRLIGALAALAALGVITWWLGRRIAREVREPEDEVPVEELVLAIVAGVTVFALADLLVARTGPNQFVDLESKTDALYFALTTLASVGYGDVHAQGQLARGIVIIQMLFNLTVLTVAVRTTIRVIIRHRR